MEQLHSRVNGKKNRCAIVPFEVLKTHLYHECLSFYLGSKWLPSVRTASIVSHADVVNELDWVLRKLL